MKQKIMIKGVGDTNRERVESLIAIEPILFFLGFKSNESWNNSAVERYIDGYLDYIQIYTDRVYEFHSHSSIGVEFKATEIKKLIDYITN